MRPMLLDLNTVSPGLLLILIMLLLYLRKKHGLGLWHLAFISIFYVYLCYVIKYTIFPLWVFDTELSVIRKQAGASWIDGLNLIPLKRVTVEYFLSRQGLGNILLTIPFGFGSPFIARTGLRSVLTRGFLFSLAIEGAQILINLAYGYGARIVDVNDVIFNVVGVLIGFSVLKILSIIYSKKVSSGEETGALWKHVHAVLTGSWPVQHKDTSEANPRVDV